MSLKTFLFEKCKIFKTYSFLRFRCNHTFAMKNEKFWAHFNYLQNAKYEESLKPENPPFLEIFEIPLSIGYFNII